MKINFLPWRAVLYVKKSTTHPLDHQFGNSNRTISSPTELLGIRFRAEEHIYEPVANTYPVSSRVLRAFFLGLLSETLSLDWVRTSSQNWYTHRVSYWPHLLATWSTSNWFSGLAHHSTRYTYQYPYWVARDIEHHLISTPTLSK